MIADSLNHYIDAMQKSLNEVESYLSEEALVELHNNCKKESIAQVC